MTQQEEVEEMTERLMKLPRALFQKSKMNSDMIVALINQQEKLLELIAHLHNLDLEALRKEIQT